MNSDFTPTMPFVRPTNIKKSEPAQQRLSEINGQFTAPLDLSSYNKRLSTVLDQFTASLDLSSYTERLSTVLEQASSNLYTSWYAEFENQLGDMLRETDFHLRLSESLNEFYGHAEDISNRLVQGWQDHAASITPLTFGSQTDLDERRRVGLNEKRSSFIPSTNLVIQNDSQSVTVEDESTNAKNKLRTEFENRFVQLIRETDFEYGFDNITETFVKNALSEYGHLAREWINHLFLINFANPLVLTAILRVIAHFQYDHVYPQGVTMAIAATSHRDSEVRECGVRCFENWEAPESLDILRNLNYAEDWLSEYINYVICDLQER